VFYINVEIGLWRGQRIKSSAIINNCYDKYLSVNEVSRQFDIVRFRII
jgi:hypothetical protein